MTLKEAIVILTIASERYSNILDDDTLDAILLAYEAAKAWKSSRDFSGINHFPLLPGETK